MSCTECQDRLSEYVDDLLEAGERELIDEHLTGCAPCRIVRDDLMQIVQASLQLQGRTPEAAAWARLKTEIEAERQRGWWSRIASTRITVSVPLFTAAIAVLLAALSAGWLVSRRDPPPAVQSSFVGAGPAHAASVQATIQEIEQRINRLDAIIELRRASWSPELRSMFDRQMLYVDQSLAECRHGLSDTPGDDVYEELMLGAYREKVRLLEEFSDY
ncbi:MAG TPA: zf-HC2 domain-containing protein [Blastocatellia bacterium]|nr:zf-HC2 domain-containing protein [Blastocatellia bacterium]